MNTEIYSIDAFKARLRKLKIKKVDSDPLIRFVENRNNVINFQNKRLEAAYQIIGANVVTECSDYE